MYNYGVVRSLVQSFLQQSDVVARCSGQIQSSFNSRGRECTEKELLGSMVKSLEAEHLVPRPGNRKECLRPVGMHPELSEERAFCLHISETYFQCEANRPGLAPSRCNLTCPRFLNFLACPSCLLESLSTEVFRRRVVSQQ